MAAILKEQPISTDKDNVYQLNSTLEQAIANLKLEGITLSHESMSDLALLSSGKLTSAEVIQKVIARAK